jgi:hypothetical protein
MAASEMEEPIWVRRPYALIEAIPSVELLVPLEYLLSCVERELGIEVSHLLGEPTPHDEFAIGLNEGVGGDAYVTI